MPESADGFHHDVARGFSPLSLTTVGSQAWMAQGAPEGPERVIMRSLHSHSLRSRIEPWIGLALCAAVVLGWAWEQLVPNPDGPQAFAPDWLPLAAVGVAAAGIMPLDGSPRWLRVQRALRWTSLLLMVWAANGLPFDLLTAAGLMGHRTASGVIVLSSVYWPGLATRALALATAVVLARLALARPAAPASTRAATERTPITASR